MPTCGPCDSFGGTALDNLFRADGTLGAATDEVSLRNTEGAVLLSVD